MISIGQLAEWILKNRKGKAFRGYSFEKITNELMECADASSMLCVTDNNDIVGVICCKRDIHKRILYVYDILTIRKGIVKRMLEFAAREYPGFTIEGNTKKGHKFFGETIKLE